MAKAKPIFNIISHGIYTPWDAKSKELPKIKKFTTMIPAEVDIEFGYIINVKKGKGIKLTFTIFHPNIPDKNGDIMEPFIDDVYVTNNDWHFFLGDTIWDPVDNKVGDWRVVIEYDGNIVADKTFEITLDSHDIVDDFALLNSKLTYRNR